MNHMKQTLKFLLSVLLVSMLGVANCSKYETGGSSTNAFLIGNYINGLVQSAITGNCAISLNMGSLYAGAILQGAVSGTNFTATQFLSAAGATSFESLGYGTSTTTQAFAYSLVPYNKKYDAFLNTTTGWTEANRNAALASQKASTDMAALVGATAVFTANYTSFSATAAGAVTAFFAGFSTAEQTAIAAAFTAIGQGANYGSAALITTQINGLSTGATAASWGGIATTIGTTAVGSAYVARNAWRSGIALLGCARIPRSSCNLAGISTSNLETDISGQIGVVNALFTTPECRKGTTGSATSSTRILTAAFAGLDKNRTVRLLNGSTYQNVTLTTDTPSELATAYGATEGGTTSAAAFANTLIASKAYPKSSALAQLGFSTAFPLATGATAYPVTTGTAVPSSQTTNSTTDATATTGSIPWYGGSNIAFSVVSSCENIGLGGVGPTPYTSSTTSTTGLPAMNTTQVDTTASSANRKALTGVNEILYAFSTNNAAATVYAALNGATYTSTAGAFPVTYNAGSIQASEDSIACNRALRGTFSINAALNLGTKLPVINTASGDGASTSLLTACIYGGTTTTRTGQAAALNSSLLNITSCPKAAQGASATFGEYGLQSFSATNGYPNGKD